ncbi:MAG: hypothetical protein LBJ00_00980, partial [Planctomycetaceae bacterium]|nr:hypothetical protein [Planctomycetaceae bacterium]
MKKSLKTILLVCSTFLAFNFAVADEPVAVDAAKYPRQVLPLPEQVLWQNMEQIMFVCLDPCTWQNLEYDNLSTPLDK